MKLNSKIFKKTLALFIVLIMTLGLAIQVQASDGPSATARIIGNNANNGTLEVTVEDIDKNSGVVTVAKPGNGARMVEVTVGDVDYQVAITFNGNTPIARLLPPPIDYEVIPYEPSAGGNKNSSQAASNATGFDGEKIGWRDGVGFHCNTAKGGGPGGPRTAVAINDSKRGVYLANHQQDNGKDPAMHTYLHRVGTTTTWIVDREDIICMTCGINSWITFSNNSGKINGKNIQLNHPYAPDLPDNPSKFQAMFSLEKTVNGINIAEWELHDWTIEDVIDDITFELYKVSGRNAVIIGEPVAVGQIEVNMLGEAYINFLPEIEETGWYAVKEIFTKDSIADVIFDDVGVKYFNIVVDGSGARIVENNYNFDYNGTYYSDEWTVYFEELSTPKQRADFTLDAASYNKAKSDASFIGGLGNSGKPHDLRQGASFANHNFADFYVSAVNGKDYSSFCADWFSGGLTQYLFDRTDIRFDGDRAYDKANIIKAFNYIYDTLGSLDQWHSHRPHGKNCGTGVGCHTWTLKADGGLEAHTKMIAQMVLWPLLNDGVKDITIWNYSDRNMINEFVEEVLEFVKDGEYEGPGRIQDVRFLAAEDYTFDGSKYLQYQPQLVPIYGDYVTFDNQITGQFEGDVSFTKEIYGGEIPVHSGQFKFEVYRIGEIDEATGKYDEELIDFAEETMFPGSYGVYNLKPGNYVIREVLTVDLVNDITGLGHGYRHVWKAVYPGDAEDGLYFTIENNGATTWKYNVSDNPIINNVYYCKHGKLWADAGNQIDFDAAIARGGIPYPAIGKPFGYIAVGNCGQYSLRDAMHQKIKGADPATCTTGEVLRLWCCASQTGTIIALSKGPLGHNWKLTYSLNKDICSQTSYERWNCTRGCDVPDIRIIKGPETCVFERIVEGFPWYWCNNCPTIGPRIDEDSSMSKEPSLSNDPPCD